jgi:hypothetical protein
MAWYVKECRGIVYCGRTVRNIRGGSIMPREDDLIEHLDQCMQGQLHIDRPEKFGYFGGEIVEFNA